MPSRTLRACAVAAVVATLALIPVTRSVARANGTALVGPKAYYLALGDSLAYGLQPNLDNDDGYADDFFVDLQTHGTQSEADMGCSGETTVTFINGHCQYGLLLPPHYEYDGPQLAAALTFIQQHPGQVSPVTIDIGANDFLNVIDPSTCSITAVTQTLQIVATNVQSIVSQLQTALHGTGDLISMTYYFPYQNQCPNLMPLVQQLNNIVAGIAQRNGALVAPVFAAFGGAGTPNPKLCSYTWVCQTNTYLSCLLLANLCIHPTTLGYKVMAGAIESTAGY